MADVEVTIFDLTKPITQKGFGLPLVFDITKDVPYTEVTETSQIPAPLVSGDMSYKMVAACLSQSPAPEKVAIYGYDIDQVGAPKTITEALNALVVEHNNFYFLLLADRISANIREAASWASANEKLFVCSTAPTDLVSEIITRAGLISSDRCAIYAHDGGVAGTDPYLDAAIVGRMAPVFPGASTWKFKGLNGVPVATYLNAAVSDLHSAYVNTYWKVLGDLITSEGKETKGGYIDIRIAKDWLKSQLVENVTQLLHTAEKIPYDDTGIAMVGARVKEILRYAVTKGIIARDLQGNGMWSLTLPKREDIPTNTRANRILPDINWEATIAGAVHQVKITGVLKV
jgi:hypothetical protein